MKTNENKTLFHTDLSSTSNKVTLSLPPLSKGVYLYKYFVNNHLENTGKLIKE